jgi:hypothetical protein
MKRMLSVCALLACLSPFASADLLTPGSKLRVTFRVDPAVPVPDMLTLNFGTVTVLAPYTLRSATLFDGGTPLGTYSSSLFGNYSGLLGLNPGASWRSPTSLWNFDNPAVVTFTSVSNATIHGAIEFTIQTGSMDIQLNQVNLTINQATGPNTTILSSPAPTIESVCIESGDITNFCPGDGSGPACPCGNSAALGSDTGCLSSLGMGARLVGCGAASISADTFELQGSQMPNSSALYFQGTMQGGMGAGTSFGDGLRCAGGTVIRLGTLTNVGGVSQYPSSGQLPVSVKGALSAGDVRTYQVWYRNAAAFCTPSTFNLSNGLQVLWQS